MHIFQLFKLLKWGGAFPHIKKLRRPSQSPQLARLKPLLSPLHIERTLAAGLVSKLMSGSMNVIPHTAEPCAVSISTPAYE